MSPTSPLEARSAAVLAAVVLLFLLSTVSARAEPLAFVTEFSDGTVSVVDLGVTPPVVLASLAVGAEPVGVAIAPGGDRVYVTNSGDDTVSVIAADETPPRVIDTIAVGDEPNGVAVSPDGLTLYVANYSADTVSVIDLSQPDPTATTLAVGELPEAVAISADGRRVYVGNSDDHEMTWSSVSVIDAELSPPAVIDTVVVEPEAHGLAVAPDGGLWVATSDTNKVARIDPAAHALGPTVATGARPYTVAIAPDGRRLYVSNPGVDAITIVDLTAVPPVTIASILDVPAVYGLQVGLHSRRLYVVSALESRLKVFDVSVSPAVELGSVEVGAVPIAYGRFVAVPAAGVFADGFESGDLRAWAP